MQIIYQTILQPCLTPAVWIPRITDEQRIKAAVAMQAAKPVRKEYKRLSGTYKQTICEFVARHPGCNSSDVMNSMTATKTQIRDTLRDLYMHGKLTREKAYRHSGQSWLYAYWVKQ